MKRAQRMDVRSRFIPNGENTVDGIFVVAPQVTGRCRIGANQTTKLSINRVLPTRAAMAKSTGCSAGLTTSSDCGFTIEI